MKKEVLFAILDSFIDDRFKELEESLSPKQGERGPRGIPGPKGKDFDFTENEEDIKSILFSYVESIKNTLRAEITQEDIEALQVDPEDVELLLNEIFDDRIEDLKLTYEELTEQQKLELKGEKGERGPRGQRGKAGDSFVFAEHEEDIHTLIKLVIGSTSDLFKLKFEDLTEEDKDSLKGERGERGPRGQRGKQGESFIFAEHESEICRILSTVINNVKNDLKLKFN
jgi:hypothetical protein